MSAIRTTSEVLRAEIGRLHMAMTSASAGKEAMEARMRSIPDAPGDTMLTTAVLAPTLIWPLVIATWTAAFVTTPALSRY